jgi:microcystin-dependent protein
MSNQPYLGEIQLFACTFAPAGWALCNGQVLSINTNQALFSLLGTTYGGNGSTNFALPDLRGRTPMGSSATHPVGEVTGAESVTLTSSHLPAHTHTVSISGVTATGRLRNAAANQRTPVATLPAIESSNALATYSSAASDANMHGSAVTLGGSLSAASAGGGQAHENRQPYLTLNYCIATQGIFPPRD